MNRSLLASIGVFMGIFLCDAQEQMEAYSPVVSYVFPHSVQNEEIISPIVAYLYEDAVGRDQDVVSPVVSYVYLDALPHNVTREVTSTSVGYFFNVGLPGQPSSVAPFGRVLDENGRALPGASVQLLEAGRPVASVISGSDGSWMTQALPPGVYELVGQLNDRIPDRRVISLSVRTAGQLLNLPIRPSAPILETRPSSEVIASTPLPPVNAEGSRLVRFSKGHWTPIVSIGDLNQHLVTVVFTHGWNSDPDAWAKGLANALIARGLGDRLNLVAWDWKSAARGVQPPEEKSPRQGAFLGRSLYEALEGSYASPVHFFGHSLGALVNASAANYLHGDRTGRQPVASTPWSSEFTHMTLFDEASVARVVGEEVVSEALSGSLRFGLKAGLILGAVEAVDSWKTPMPKHAAWVDNYISVVGFYRKNALNICLSKAIPLTDSLIKAHSYPQTWYEDSIRSSENLPAGFRRSWEANLVDDLPSLKFPPSEPEFALGDVYHQSAEAQGPLRLEPLPPARIHECLFPGLGVTAEIVVTEVLDSLKDAAVATMGTTMEIAQTGVDLASDAVGFVAERTKQGREAIVDLGRRTVLRILIKSRPLNRQPGSGVRRAGFDDPVGEEGGIRISIRIPPDASLLLFDFSVEGDGGDDVLVCSLNDLNQFTLETQFVPPGVLQTSRALDVSALAGSTNQLFFGLLGGTSTNCSLTIENLRFLTFQAPRLDVERTPEGAALLSWSSHLDGYSLETVEGLDQSWIAITDMPMLYAGKFWMTNSAAENTRYFRLRQD